MRKMIATVTVLPGPGTTEDQLAQFLRTQLVQPGTDDNPVAFVVEVAVSTVPDEPTPADYRWADQVLAQCPRDDHR